jgi:RNA polymerase sigma-70 factor, ECF subfamily
MSVAVHSRPEIDPVAREQRMRGLFEATAGPLRRYLVRLTQGQPEAAEDLLQETMLRAWRKVDDLPEDAESLRRWIFTVARNVAVDAVRTRMARPTEVYSDHGPWTATADEDIDRLLDRQMLRDALSRLSERHRAVLLALYGRDISVADAAESLGIPEGATSPIGYVSISGMRLMCFLAVGRSGCSRSGRMEKVDHPYISDHPGDLALPGVAHHRLLRLPPSRHPVLATQSSPAAAPRTLMAGCDCPPTAVRVSDQQPETGQRVLDIDQIPGPAEPRRTRS